MQLNMYILVMLERFQGVLIIQTTTLVQTEISQLAQYELKCLVFSIHAFAESHCPLQRLSVLQLGQ